MACSMRPVLAGRAPSMTIRLRPDATHGSLRSMAAETGFPHTTIRRMRAAFGFQPHRGQTFKLSDDPLFVGKVRDIVGL